ncbi:MAG TPA: hypothetical protein VIS06_18055, partial [Mycobacteriales bacterium]
MPRLRAYRNNAAGPPRGTPTQHGIGAFTHRLVLAAVLAAGVAGWLRLIESPLFNRLAPSQGGVEYLLLDAMLVLPLAMASATVAARVAARFEPSHRPIGFALSTSAGLALLLVPLMPLRGGVLSLLRSGAADPSSPPPVGSALPGLGGWVGQGLGYAVLTWPVLLVLALLTVAMSLALPRWPRVRRLVARTAMLGLVTATAGTLTSAPAMAAPTTESTTAQTVAASGGCDDAAVPKRTYDVVALHIDIPLNRFGDHDPYGYMYTLAQNEAAVRAFSAATTGPDPTAKVSVGLREDPIQPLVLRARLGECVVINFANKLDLAPHAGNDAPVGPIPSVSMDVQGVSYQIADGGSAVGQNPTSRMTPPNATNTYRFYLDPLSGEGGKVFHSGGDSRQLTARGLFGALIAEPAGSHWFDPMTGEDKTDDPTWSNWEAMIQPGTGFAFREFSIMYHEQGDEDAHLNRPLSAGPGPEG